jgi:hypothetical protein
MISIGCLFLVDGIWGDILYTVSVVWNKCCVAKEHLEFVPSNITRTVALECHTYQDIGQFGSFLVAIDCSICSAT